jgi:hypothetical protein
VPQLPTTRASAVAERDDRSVMAGLLALPSECRVRTQRKI